MKVYNDIFKDIISLKNLFLAWDEFKKDKRHKIDVQKFEFNLEENVFKLHRELDNKSYSHGSYTGFYITDPKLRHIHKAKVRDRILHHAVYKILLPIFEPTFIPNSFSCRKGKGSHKGVDTLAKILRKVSQNNTRNCYALKCDIKKFFDSVDHYVLLVVLCKRIKDKDTMWLMEDIINSYSSNIFQKKGLPIGNLTSQIFANIYMNKLDQYIKQELKVKHYVRYTDDFIIVSDDKEYLKNILKPISKFLSNELLLQLHPKKVSIRKYSQGIDFLGHIIFPYHKLIRANTKKRMIRKLELRRNEYEDDKITKYTYEQSLQSYLGVLSHANAYDFSNDLRNSFIQDYYTTPP
ncbi:MAG: reverse transcriptase/maturase family protein [Patescibacteria group bacterium]|nr:reverse transcriptase/maturase family protein [Patescibacteria group bacterium]